ncbi:hypothetical protein LAZ67_20002683 [Cordylochernes scorpioides]|uniref:PiggyBac transposable element-derived protein domain-containing protein n=1 Tax=Cordylochernes scorpioides TaxID=51811 RepID=A0ABY6LL25_9ARAC|nr:hypothetical protein LAZ67_20002683 [Cordylochernes scorpioides]
MYHPGEYLTVDENIIPFIGRCSFKQYLPNKPAKYGIKSYVLCFSRTSYVVNIDIYAGKQPEGPYQISNSPNNVVERLVLPISGSKRNITTDNWYTSYPLAVALLNDHKLTLVGTLKNNKKEITPEFMLNRARQVFSSIFSFQKNVSLVSYVPKRGKSAILLSTMHTTATIDEKINSKLLFDGNQPQNIYKRRKDFLKALSLELVTEYHHIRSTTKSFSKLLRSIARKHAGQSPETMEEIFQNLFQRPRKDAIFVLIKKDQNIMPEVPKECL